MSFVVVGLSHRTAPVQLRERIAFPEEQQPEALAQLVGIEVINEAVIVSTCNRMEIYAEVKSATEGIDEIIMFLSHYHGLSDEEALLVDAHLYTVQSAAMIEHLFRVVSSLDSLVLGEAQILGQVRRAYEIAFEAGACAETFNRLFRKALQVGKRTRTDTAIGANSVSISTAAVNLACRIFEKVDGRSVLVVGAGEMSELTVQYLIEQGAKTVFVANRTFERSKDLAQRVGGQAVPYEDLVEYMGGSDIVIASTAAPGYVIDKRQVAQARRRRRGHSFLMIDIALPRDIDPTCSELDDVYLYDLDDLGSIVDDNVKERAVEAVKAESLVAEEVDAFLVWLQEREVIPTIKQMYTKAEHSAQREIERAGKALASLKGSPLNDDEHAILEAMSQSIIKKSFHGPTARLRAQIDNPNAYRYTEAARFLFGLDTNPLGLSCTSDDGRLCRLKTGKSCAAAQKGTCHHITPASKDEAVGADQSGDERKAIGG